MTVTGSKLVQVYLNVNWKGNKNCTDLDGPDPSGYANFCRYSFTSPALKIKHGKFDGKMKEDGTTRDQHYSASVTVDDQGGQRDWIDRRFVHGLAEGCHRHGQVLDWTCALHRDGQGVNVMRVNEAAHLCDE